VCFDTVGWAPFRAIGPLEHPASPSPKGSLLVIFGDLASPGIIAGKIRLVKQKLKPPRC